jgi:hypothetical protein
VARTGGVTVAITVAREDRLVVITGTGSLAVFAALAHLEVSMALASLALGTLASVAATGWCRHVTINATFAVAVAAIRIDVGVSGVAHVSVNWVEVISWRVITGRVIAGGLMIAAFGALRHTLARPTF